MQPKKVLRTIRKIYWPVIFMCLLLVLFFPFSSVLISAEAQSGNTDGLQILSDHKKEMEQQAFILVGLLESEDITQKEYATGQTLYGEAQAALDRWIAQLQHALQEGKDPESSEAYQAALQEAENTSEKFLEYVHEKFLGDPRGEKPEGTRKVVDTMQAAARLLQAGLPEDRPALSQNLEAYKFNQLCPDPPCHEVM